MDWKLSFSREGCIFTTSRNGSKTDLIGMAICLKRILERDLFDSNMGMNSAWICSQVTPQLSRVRFLSVHCSELISPMRPVKTAAPTVHLFRIKVLTGRP